LDGIVNHILDLEVDEMALAVGRMLPIDLRIFSHDDFVALTNELVVDLEILHLQ